MNHRKFKADYIFTGNEILDENHVLITNHEGVVQDILPFELAGNDVEVFKGILSPGFVNSHCHLELSHLKDLIPEKTGLVDFVLSVVTQRDFPKEIILDAIAKGEEEMISRGIVAVGDICNSPDTIPQKQLRRLNYYNFIEMSGWAPEIASERLAKGKMLFESFKTRLSTNGHRHLNLTPHAPYSVSDKLWSLIEPFFNDKTTSIHNQESAYEDELFKTGSGDLLRIYELLKIRNNSFRPTGKSSVQSYLSHLSGSKNIVLVHNSFITEEDLQYCQQQAPTNPGQGHINLYYCLCVNANKYIEDVMPPIELLRKYNCNIVLGTDSLASNSHLDILSEMKAIQANHPLISLQEILTWATINGARALDMEDVVGSFSRHKKPGIILLKNIDGLQLTSKSSVKRLI